MKAPLSYQTTEYDCGPTTLINAIRFLFRRSEIPPDVVKHIMLYSLDAYNCRGEFGKSGTSGMAMMFLSNWLNQFGRAKKFPIRCEFVTGPQVDVGQNSALVGSLQQGGAAIARVRYGCWHYVLLTGADERHVYLFDPYYRKKPFSAQGVELVEGRPGAANRRVAADLLNSEGRGIYALGPRDKREAMLLYNENTRQSPLGTIEYFI